MVNKKAIVLIDGGYFDNLNFWLKKKRGKKIGVEKLSLRVCEGMDHFRTKFYNANPYQNSNPTEEEKNRYKNTQKFQYAINRLPRHEFVKVGRVRKVPVNCPNCKGDLWGRKQKGVDIAIALDLVKMARKKVADVFILLSGDEDFASAVEMAQEELCNVIVYFSSDQEYNIFGSKKLNNTASDRVKMDLNFLENCAMD